MKTNFYTFTILMLAFSLITVRSYSQRNAGGYSDGKDAVAQLTLANYPNPVNANTTVKYEMPNDGNVSLRVYNSIGQYIATLYEGDQKAGSYTIDFNATQMARGMYVCRFAVVNGDKKNVLTRKMNIVR